MRNLLKLYLATFLLAFGSNPSWAQSYANEEAAIASNFTRTDDMECDTTPPGGGPGTCGFAGSNLTEAKYRQNCEFSHHNKDDALLFPGLIGGSPHAHSYYGNTLANGNSTYSTLRQTGDGSCAGKRLNRTAYWVPAMFTNDAETQIKVPDFVQVYYNYGKDRLPGGSLASYDTLARLPFGLRWIGGAKPGDPTYYDTATPGVTLASGSTWVAWNGHFGWKCESGGSWYTNLDDPGLNCAAGDRLRTDLLMPECWDGSSISSANQRTHVVYPAYRQSEGNFADCPTSHNYRIVEVSLALFYSHNGPSDYRNWHLASDRQSTNSATWQADGSTFHADIFLAWDEVWLKRFQRNCNQLTIDGTGPYDSNSDCGGGTAGGGQKGLVTHINEGDSTDATNLYTAPSDLRAGVAATFASSASRLKLRFKRK